jgi:hypothetical protein
MPTPDTINIGHFIGVAAVIASLPEARSVEADRVRRIIEDITSSSGFADDREIEGAARSIAATIIAAAKIEVN